MSLVDSLAVYETAHNTSIQNGYLSPQDVNAAWLCYEKTCRTDYIVPNVDFIWDRFNERSVPVFSYNRKLLLFRREMHK